MNSFNINLYNLIILLGIVHGVVFSLILVINPRLKSSTNIYLALTTFALCGSNFQYLLIDTGVVSLEHYKNNLLFIPFEFLMVTMFYFFVRSYLNLTIKNKNIFLFLVPFFLGILYQVLTKLLGVEYKFVYYLNWTAEYLSLIFSIVLIVLTFKDIIDYEKKVNTENFKDIPKTTHWLKRTLVFGITLCILWLISITFLRSILGKGYYKYYPLWIGISVLIYWIGYTSIIQNLLYKDRLQIRKKTDKEKNEKSSITNIKSKNKFEEIHQFVLENQLYLDTEMTLSVLSKKIKISEGYLSQLINKNHGKNYNDYINGLRIEHVKKILVNDEYSNYTITAIGLESGFKTKTSFYAIFKKHTGKTPNQYKKLVQNL